MVARRAIPMNGHALPRAGPPKHKRLALFQPLWPLGRLPHPNIPGEAGGFSQPWQTFMAGVYTGASHGKYPIAPIGWKRADYLRAGKLGGERQDGLTPRWPVMAACPAQVSGAMGALCPAPVPGGKLESCCRLRDSRLHCLVALSAFREEVIRNNV
jgi:hypothetical protein